MRTSVNVWKEVLDGLKGMGRLEELDEAGRERIVAWLTGRGDAICSKIS